MPKVAANLNYTVDELELEWEFEAASDEDFCDFDTSDDDKPQWLVELEKQPTDWLKFFYPDQFTRDFAGYQKEFWQWATTIQLNVPIEPRVECEPRGVGKSSNLRALVVYALATKKRNYALYVSETHTQAEKHFGVIQQMLGNQLLLKYYPHLLPKVSERKNIAQKWSAKGLVTAAGQLVEFISLMSNARGFNSAEGKRIDFLALDDIDAKTDSPKVTQKKLDILASDLIPAGNVYTLIVFAQNLIHRNSICVKIKDQTADIIINREFVGPFPLMKSYKAERVKKPGSKTGAMQWSIIDGQPYDPAISVEYCETLLNQMGKAAFERECQQKVFEIEADKDFREFDEIFHVITYSEFIHTFTRLKTRVVDDNNNLFIPRRWNVGRGLDFGTTPEHPTAVIHATRPDKSTPLHDCHFLFGETVRPVYPPAQLGDVELVSPGRIAKAMKALETDWQVDDSQIMLSLMSHEQSAALNTMLLDLPDSITTEFNKWKAVKGSGVAQTQNLLEIDYEKPHPFRVYPEGHDKAGEPVMGRPRFFILVPDEQGELFCDDSGNLYVRSAMDEQGFSRLRDEIPLYSQYNSGQDKIFDDAVDALKGLMNVFGVEPDEQTTRERHVSKLDASLKPEAVEETFGTDAFVDKVSAQHHALRKIKLAERKESESVSDIVPERVITNRRKANRFEEDDEEFEW